MELYSQTATNESGDIVNSASVSVTIVSSGSPATIYDKDGGALSNPFLTGYDRSKGEVEFQAVNGLYNITVTGNPSATKKNQALFDSTDPVFDEGVAVGGAVVGDSGLAFPSSAVAVADPNTLDDYEEGSWTPAYISTGGGESVTYDLQYGRYSKIGNHVIVFGELRTDSWGSGSGTIEISGLPFAPVSVNNEAGTGVCSIEVGQGFTTQGPTINDALTTSRLKLKYNSGGVSVALPVANMATGTNSNRLKFSCTYKTS